MVDFTINSPTDRARNWGLMLDNAENRAQQRWTDRNERTETARANTENRQMSALQRQINERIAPMLQGPDTSGYAPAAPQQSGLVNLRPPEQAGLATDQDQAAEQSAQIVADDAAPSNADAFPNTTAALNAPDHGPMQLPPNATINQRNVHGVYTRGLQHYLAGRTSESALTTYIANMERTGLISSAQGQQLLARHRATRNHRRAAPVEPNEPGTGTRALRDVPLDASEKSRAPAAAPASASFSMNNPADVQRVMQAIGPVGSTVRSQEEQRALVASRATSATNSRHLPGAAVDFRLSDYPQFQTVQQLGVYVRQRWAATTGLPAASFRDETGIGRNQGTGAHVHVQWDEGGTPGANQQQAGLQTEEDEIVNQTGDASRPTGGGNLSLIRRELIRGSLEMADVYARNGNVPASQQALAAAIQGEAADTEARLRASSQQLALGNFDAAADAIAEMNNYEPGTVQFAPAEETGTYNLQVRMGEEWQTVNTTPRSIEDWSHTLAIASDATTRAAWMEAQASSAEAALEAQTRLQVANIEASSRIAGNFSEEQRALLSARTQIAIAEGRVQVARDEATGNMFVFSTEYAEDGSSTLEVGMVRVDEQEGPSNGGQAPTVQVPTYTRVNGLGFAG